MKKILLKRQQGMSMIGMLIVIMLIIGFALLAMKLTPIYIRNNSIKTILEGMSDTPGITKMTPKKIKKMIIRRIDINSIYDFDNKTLTVKKVKGYFVLKAEYEVREHLVGNVDVVLSFKEKTEIPIR